MSSFFRYLEYRGHTICKFPIPDSHGGPPEAPFVDGITVPERSVVKIPVRKANLSPKSHYIKIIDILFLLRYSVFHTLKQSKYSEIHRTPRTVHRSKTFIRCTVQPRASKASREFSPDHPEQNELHRRKAENFRSSTVFLPRSTVLHSPLYIYYLLILLK